MNIIDIIECKRDGGSLSTAQIDWFISQLSAGNLPDYQTAALLMAIYLQKMSRRETVDLTLAMARSGEMLDLHDVVPFAVDKHSSGGVGDKTTLVVQPIVAACGVPVAKMSGRGLGASGGTLDKMEAIDGWQFQMTLPQFKQQVSEIGIVLAGQTAQLAPADGILYALRDVTGTVSSIPLIAGSIMSKKLAAGADAIVLDVKVGNGAFMSTIEEARQLAEIMVAIGNDAGRQTVALLSDMNQPLGLAIGNKLEVVEAIETLRGDGPPDFWLHCETVAAHMLRLAGKADSLDAAAALARAAIRDGSAFEKFRAMVVAQGGDGNQVDDPARMAAASTIIMLTADRTGVIAKMDTLQIGWSSVHLGGGRIQKSDQIDHSVGFVMRVKVGDSVVAGQPLVEIHAKNEAEAAQAMATLQAAIVIGDEPVAKLPHIHGTVGA